MPDYIYMLESRLSAEQRAALARIEEAAAAVEFNIYLVGGAVRDIVSGMPIRDLDFTVEGNPSRLARELEKSGAKVVSENESLRHIELLLPGDVDVSIAAARDDVYSRPGTRPEIRFSSITEDLKRRDFSINAIAISLSANSRGLLLDPANGLADLERREIRVLSIHSFTNQPVRLLRALRYAARMGFKMDARTNEWFNLAIERGLHETILPADAGSELRQVASEEKPAAILKAWESQGFLDAIHARLAKRHPDYEALNRIARVRDDMWATGLRPRVFAPVTIAILGRLASRERSAVLSRVQFRSAEIDSLSDLESESEKVVKTLAGRKTALPRDAWVFFEKTPLEILAYILAESSNSKAVGKIKNYLNKWKPLRQALPGVAVELEAIGLPHGPKFDKVLEEFFLAQLAGKARKPEDHAKLLRKLAGIKEPPKKVEEKKKPEKPKKKGEYGGDGDAVAAAGTVPAAPPSSKAGKPQADATPSQRERKDTKKKSAPKAHGKPKTSHKKK